MDSLSSAFYISSSEPKTEGSYKNSFYSLSQSGMLLLFLPNLIVRSNPQAKLTESRTNPVHSLLRTAIHSFYLLRASNQGR